MSRIRRRMSMDSKGKARDSHASPLQGKTQNVRDDFTSPTSIVTIPLSESRQPFSPILNVCDTGELEVSLNNAPRRVIDLDDSSPLKMGLQMAALLDGEVTPSPPSLKKNSSNISTLTDFSATPRRLPFCGMIAPDCCNNVGESWCSQSQAHQKISTILSAEEPEYSWQLWSVDSIEDSELVSSTTTTEIKANLNRVLQNRAFHMTARKKRLSNLKENMHIERSSSRRLFKTQSFNIERPRKFLPNQKFSIWNLGSCGTTSTIVEEDSLSAHVDDSYCYDSDPEEFLRRPFKSMVARKRDDGDKENNPPPSDDSSLGVDDLDSIKEKVQCFMNKRWTILHHIAGAKSSIAVHVWTERGQRLDQHILPPKLQWGAVNRNRHPTVANFFNILDVHRILVPTEIDRDVYPFVKREALVIVKTVDESALFEFKDTKERDHFVYGLKLLVSRLGALLVIGDYNQVDEFFNIEQDGPGNAPVFLDEL